MQSLDGLKGYGCVEKKGECRVAPARDQLLTDRLEDRVLGVELVPPSFRHGLVGHDTLDLAPVLELDGGGDELSLGEALLLQCPAEQCTLARAAAVGVDRIVNLHTVHANDRFYLKVLHLRLLYNCSSERYVPLS